ncbi:MAG: dimethylargininase [Saprospirales bacterium]|nr:dimethylargininase [Saprospirales bacterium]
MPIAITRNISPRMEWCELTHQEREPINIALAEKQHEEYEDALRKLGCELVRAPDLPDYPDSVFVEDCAVVFDELALITRPGAESRRAEAVSLEDVLEPYRKLHYIETPGTLDGGDVLQLGKRVLVGLSGRTNRAGFEQLHALLTPLGYMVEGVVVRECLHLKSAVTQVGEKTVLLNPDWVDPLYFEGMEIIEVHPDEPEAANALLIGDTVIYPADFPFTALRLAEAGIELLLVDNSEVLKAEGGVTCCSVVFDE